MTHKAGSEVAPKVCHDAFNAGDLDGLINLFEPEAVVFLGPNQVIAGSGRIREAFAAFLEAGWRWKIKLVSHHRVGDIALNTVEHTLRKNSPGGGEDTLRFRAAVVFRQQADGSRRFLIDNAAPSSNQKKHSGGLRSVTPGSALKRLRTDRSVSPVPHTDVAGSDLFPASESEVYPRSVLVRARYPGVYRRRGLRYPPDAQQCPARRGSTPRHNISSRAIGKPGGTAGNTD
jgi:ketosteroid isomerase-like protein